MSTDLRDQLAEFSLKNVKLTLHKTARPFLELAEKLVKLNSTDSVIPPLIALLKVRNQVLRIEERRRAAAKNI